LLVVGAYLLRAIRIMEYAFYNHQPTAKAKSHNPKDNKL
tara:strand:- start:502 stop:618 length:117 start_codon:yes stop_codon:yes gene_type:complete